MDDKCFPVVMVGALVSGSLVRQFAEKCKPHSTAEMIEALIRGIVNDDLKITKAEVEQK